MPITLEIIEGPDATRDAGGWEHYAYTVRLRRGTRVLTTPWMQGLGITSEPSAEDVLESLLLDASGYDCALDFEGWSAEYGYDSDSREAERVYKQVGTLTRKLRRFLGDDFTIEGDASEHAHNLARA